MYIGFLIVRFAFLANVEIAKNLKFFQKKKLGWLSINANCVEDLNIRKMMQGKLLAKSIADASWNQFCQYLTCKAEEAGRKLGVVNPAYTTQTCYMSGNIEEKQLNERQHNFSSCGYNVSRDFNAAQNILAIGLDGLGVIPRSLLL